VSRSSEQGGQGKSQWGLGGSGLSPCGSRRGDGPGPPTRHVLGSVFRSCRSGVLVSRALPSSQSSPSFFVTVSSLSRTAIAVKCKDGVVFAVEKMVRSKMLVEGSSRRICAAAPHVGMVCAGFTVSASTPQPNFPLTCGCSVGRCQAAREPCPR
jgi:hypothetical protein